MNKKNVQQRFAKAKDSYADQAIAQQLICNKLVHLMQKFTPCRFERVFEIGCGSGNLTRLLLEKMQIQHYVVNDLYPEVKEFFDDEVNYCLGDIEAIEIPKLFNLVCSSSALQWVQHLDILLKKVNQSLANDGWFCFSTFGQKNLLEIKTLTGQGLTYYTAHELKELLTQQNFEVLYCEEKIVKLKFEAPLHILKHLKETGVTATQSSFRWTKSTLSKFYRDYEQFVDEKQQYCLTYHPIYIIAWRKS